MVFKKPYAFLIKNFKLIHLILLLLIIYTTVKFNNVASFFRTFASSSTLSIGADSGSYYVTNLLYLSSGLIIIFAALMLLLMFKKKKPYLFYVLLLVYYVIILIASVSAYNIINALADGSTTQQTARMYQDIYMLLSLPNYYFIVMSFIRGFGFDVKKFNFNRDLEELEINSSDNEEFEFVLGTDTYKYKRKLHRFLREAKYYILENKFVFTIVSCVVGAIIILVIVLNINFIHKVYHVGDTVLANGIQLRINKSYITERDVNGSKVKSGKKYVIVDATVTNILSDVQPIKRERIYLKYGNKNVYYSTSIGDLFNDLGKSYSGSSLTSNVDNRLLFIFEIPSSVSNTSFNFNIINNISMDEKGNNVIEYLEYKITPQDLDIKLNTEKKKFNEQMFLGSTTFDKSYINIKNAEFKTSYEYEYTTCDDNDKTICQTYKDVIKPTVPISQQLLVIEYSMSITDKALINTSLVSQVKNKYLFDDFIKLKYTNGDSYMTKAVSTKINEFTKNKVFIVVSNNVVNAKKVQLLINTRYNHYYINLK